MAVGYIELHWPTQAERRPTEVQLSQPSRYVQSKLRLPDPSPHDPTRRTDEREGPANPLASNFYHVPQSYTQLHPPELGQGSRARVTEASNRVLRVLKMLSRRDR